MLVSLCLLCSNLNVHAKPFPPPPQKKTLRPSGDTCGIFKSVFYRLNYPILLLLCSYEFCFRKHILFEDMQVFLM
jgi:hypothetical protein